MRRATVLVFGALVLVGACRPASRDARLAELESRERRIATRLARPALDSSPTRALARWILPRDLAEISGVALTTDGSLYAHDDERGQVFQIDPRRGVVTKRFSFGTLEAEARDDFEGMTIAGGRIFIVASTGRLYEFAEGAPGERVRFSVHDTELEGQCEFEGVAWDPTLASFLLVCKRVLTPGWRDHLVLYRWRMRHGGGNQLAPIVIPLAIVIGTNPWKTLNPSDIAVDPVTGNYVIIAGQERAIIVITPSGEVVRSTTLPGVHAQAEAVAMTPEGILILGDEATSRPASLTLHHWPLTAATPPGPP
jgi:uncharacterized protein YjiK